MADEGDLAQAAAEHRLAAVMAAHRARRQAAGESLHFCRSCGAVIPEGRRLALPGVSLCVDCATKIDKGRR